MYLSDILILELSGKSFAIVSPHGGNVNIETTLNQLEKEQTQVSPEGLNFSPGNELVNLQMVLVNTSISHEYTRKAFEKCGSYDKKEELLHRMEELKNLYFTTREKILLSHPERLESLENELRLQKSTALNENGLH